MAGTESCRHANKGNSLGVLTVYVSNRLELKARLEFKLRLKLKLKIRPELLFWLEFKLILELR